jgi:hypothetical protein
MAGTLENPAATRQANIIDGYLLQPQEPLPGGAIGNNSIRALQDALPVPLALQGGTPATYLTLISTVELTLLPAAFVAVKVKVVVFSIFTSTHLL